MNEVLVGVPIATEDSAQAPTLDEKTRDTLRTAKGLVAAGWCQGIPSDGQGRHCALGALISAGDIGGTYNRARFALSTALGVDDGDIRLGHLHPIALWNDRIGRTQAEVVALFDRALVGRA